MDRFFHAKVEWERLALRQLYQEYEQSLRNRGVRLKPAAIELFNSETYWGQWDSQTRTIRLSRKLIRDFNWFQVVGILLHEMAHQLVDELDPIGAASGTAHGECFRKACVRLGVPAEFSKATSDLQSHSLDWREQKQDEASERMLDKVQKLLALAESGNENEALVAMGRVREIYAKYNLEQAAREQTERMVHIIITTGSKRIQLYEQQIIGILVGHFFVQVLTGPLYDVPSGEFHRAIEIIGTRENAIMAEYVFHFLKQQSEHLLKEAERSRRRKFNRLEKKSYRMGILRGFAQKLKAAEQAGRTAATSEAGRAAAGSKGTTAGANETSRSEVTRSADDSRTADSQLSFSEKSSESRENESDRSLLVGKALMAFEKDRTLDNYIARVYPRIRRTSRGTHTVDTVLYSRGQDAGKKISLHKPVTSSAVSQGRLLGSGSGR